MQIKKNKKSAAVIGAGISGLTCAYELQKAGFKVTVYEKESRVGGRMSSIQKNGFIFDIGANHLINLYTEMRKYCKEFAIKWQRFPFVNYNILYQGKMRHPMSILPFSSKIKLAVMQLAARKMPSYFNLSDLLKYDMKYNTDNASKKNAYYLAKKKIGEIFSDYITEGYTSGYQFHSAKEISSAAFLSQMNSIRKNNPDWYLHRTEGGMISLPNALARTLNVKLNTTIKKVSPHTSYVLIDKKKYDIVVLATTANITAKILDNPSKEQQDFLNKVKYSSSIVVAFRVDKKCLGDVDPEKDTSKTVSTIWLPKIESSIIASVSNEAYKGEEMIKKNKTLLCAFLHEDGAKKLLKKSNKEIFLVVKKELIKHLPWFTKESQLENFDLYKWECAMPKYYPGYIQLADDFLKKEQGKNNIFFCGDYLNAVWTEGALRCGQRVAETIVKSKF